MILVHEYVDQRGRSPFASWFDALNRNAAVKVTVALERLAQGHTSAIKPVGEEFRSTGSILVRGIEFTSEETATLS